MRAQIGIKEAVVPWTSSASEDAIWHFALGVGDDNPIWWGREYAEASRVGRMYAPPTLLYTAASEARKPGNTAKPSGVEVWLPGALGLWAGDRWTWHSRIWADEKISATRELHEVRERAGKFAGRSVAQTERVIFTGEDGRLVAEMYRTILRFEREASRHNSKYLETPEARYSPAERQAIVDQYARNPRTAAAPSRGTGRTSPPGTRFPGWSRAPCR